MPLSILRIEENLVKYLSKKFPNRKKSQITKFTSLSKGWETELFSFIYKYQLNEQEFIENLILRMYPGVNSHSKTQREYIMLKTLYELGYPVPETFVLELDRKFLGKSFILMEKISGEDMGVDFFQFLQEGELKRIKEEILPIMNKLLVKLHKLDWREFKSKIGLDLDIDIEEYWIKKLEKMEKRLRQNQLLELIPILDWLKENSKQIKPSLAVIHGDFHPHNIMISDEGEACVIDWPSCTVGDYREDLGWTLMLTGAYTSKEIRDIVLTSYEDYRGSKVENIKYFEIVSAFRRLEDIILIFKKGSEETGMREEAKQQIKETAFHLKYIISFVKEITKKNISQVEEFLFNQF